MEKSKWKKERAGQLALDTRSSPEDLGFKVFKLAPSNYRQWDAAQTDAAAYTQQAELFADPLVAGWQPENVLYEIALKEGYGLNVIVESVGADGTARIRSSASLILTRTNPSTSPWLPGSLSMNCAHSI